MQPEFYEVILERLQKEYALRADRSEHAFITEFFEGPLPLFKLIMSAAEGDAPALLIISFHLQVDSPSAIQWFLRLRNLDPNLHLSACYIKDSEGISYIGEDAEILMLYMIEQDIVSAWAASDLDSSDVLNKQLPTVKPSPLKVYSDYRKAIIEFHRIDKKKGDVSH